jgi:hypothetical protein
MADLTAAIQDALIAVKRPGPRTAAGYLAGLALALLGLRVLYADLAPVTVAYATAHGWLMWTLWALAALTGLDLTLRVRWQPATWLLHAAAGYALWMSALAPVGWTHKTWAVLAIAYLWAVPYTAARLTRSTATRTRTTPSATRPPRTTRPATAPPAP